MWIFSWLDSISWQEHLIFSRHCTGTFGITQVAINTWALYIIYPIPLVALTIFDKIICYLIYCMYGVCLYSQQCKSSSFVLLSLQYCLHEFPPPLSSWHQTWPPWWKIMKVNKTYGKYLFSNIRNYLSLYNILDINIYKSLLCQLKEPQFHWS